MAAVERVSFVRWKGAESWQREKIGDAERIRQVLALLAAHNSGYYRRRLPFGPGEPKGQEYTISFEGELSVPLVVSIGPDWLGGVDQQVGKDGWRKARFRSLGASEREELLRACCKGPGGESGAP